MSPVTDLDLGEIRKLLAQDHNFHRTRAIELLLAAVEKLQAENARLERLLGADPFPTLDGYEAAMQALADERARVGALETVLGEVLRHFPAALDADLRDTVRSREVPEVTVARWRRIAEGGGTDV